MNTLHESLAAPLLAATQFENFRKQFSEGSQRAMRNVPKIFDGGDVSDNAEGTGPGSWHGEEMCCLECRETAAMGCGITPTYLLAKLECGECGETFAEYWV